LIHPDLWIGLGFCAIWYALYRPAIYRFVGIQHDLNIHTLISAFKFFLAVCLAVIIGTATHLIWDGITHVDFRTFAFHEVLAQHFQLFGQSYPLHRILQIGTSVIVLPLILWMSLHYYKTHQQYLTVSLKIKAYACGLLLFSIFTGLF